MKNLIITINSAVTWSNKKVIDSIIDNNTILIISLKSLDISIYDNDFYNKDNFYTINREIITTWTQLYYTHLLIGIRRVLS